MTPEQERLVFSMVTVPGGGEPLSPGEFLRRFGAGDGRELGVTLLREAVERQIADEVELALIVCSVFGFGPEHFGLLVGLVGADWHVKHEDVVSVLARLRDPAAVEALYYATWWVPAYLEFDENRALARKAVRALGGLPGEEATAALRQVLATGDAVVREFAVRELARQEAQG